MARGGLRKSRIPTGALGVLPRGPRRQSKTGLDDAAGGVFGETGGGVWTRLALQSDSGDCLAPSRLSAGSQENSGQGGFATEGFGAFSDCCPAAQRFQGQGGWQAAPLGEPTRGDVVDVDVHELTSISGASQNRLWGEEREWTARVWRNGTNSWRNGTNKFVGGALEKRDEQFVAAHWSRKCASVRSNLERSQRRSYWSAVSSLGWDIAYPSVTQWPVQFCTASRVQLEAVNKPGPSRSSFGPGSRLTWRDGVFARPHPLGPKWTGYRCQAPATTSLEEQNQATFSLPSSLLSAFDSNIGQPRPCLPLAPPPPTRPRRRPPRPSIMSPAPAPGATCHAAWIPPSLADLDRS
ncbi:hypothetical protein GGTG_04045 [Gaeumannomyces tritici R3-111a-1]|uniref:Uncharacterized protein n=1 Tax=Gaeumannomyces tritici (strain R3-111a-1) TaxID=644352 RepID=J3NRZ7_GAET3|nr:hypothetical protein GGTG_04045 [Gaeumannomyces tritici R3-111a-1]EJT78953.1 hypothetical protein GGTG_04045 [Gaeumannomyces tritici R3-111a-1]